MACDLRVMAEGAYLLQAFINIALVPDGTSLCVCVCSRVCVHLCISFSSYHVLESIGIIN